jgi:hypothetical protein
MRLLTAIVGILCALLNAAAGSAGGGEFIGS